jgi:hypothetical protein
MDWAAAVGGAQVTDVPAGIYRTDKHEYYWNGDGPYPGVTSVLNVIDKPALAAWAKRETAECAIRNLDLLTGMVRTGGDRMAVEWLKQIPDYVRDTAANLVTSVHNAADAYARGELLELDPEQMPFLDAYRTALEREGIVPIASEFRVIGHVDGVHRYGGTGDLLCTIDGETWLIDLKTSAGTYKETALQLAAYGFADFIGFESDPTPYAVPQVDRYGVLHIRPDKYPTAQEGGYRLIEYEVTADTFAAFEAAYRLSQWLKEHQGTK